LLSAGSGLDPDQAMRAALVEVATYLPEFQQRVEARLDLAYDMIADPTKTISVEHHQLLYGLPEMFDKTRFLLDNPTVKTVEETYTNWNARRPRNADLRDDLMFCVGEILEKGMDVIVVDQTSPTQAQIGVHTVATIVPGLMPIDFGYGRDRTYTLPRLRTVPYTQKFYDQPFNPVHINVDLHPFP
jgi:ribosomal protein S12 methylthiotransferase accessory factor